jgi:hypothetical protein
MRLNLSIEHPDSLVVVFGEPDALERHDVGGHVLDVAPRMARECPKAPGTLSLQNAGQRLAIRGQPFEHLLQRPEGNELVDCRFSRRP